MKNKYLILIYRPILAIFVFLSLALNAQQQSFGTHFYYYKNEKTYIQVDFSRISVISEGTIDVDSIRKIDNCPTFSIKNEGLSYTMQNVILGDDISKEVRGKEIFITELEFSETLNQANYFDIIQRFTMVDNILKVTPTYSISNHKMGISNNFYVKLFKEEDMNALFKFAESHSIVVLGYNEFMPLWFTLSCGRETSLNAIEAANLFYESSLFESAEPEFLYHNLLTSSDQYFPNQWGLKNTGQHCSTSNIDICAESAWNITTGSPNIRVAIFDQGIKMDHPDLINNIYGTGYDAVTNTTHSVLRGSHGTPCAGIVGAEQNNTIGVSGVSPNIQLISISIDLSWGNTPQQLANGFSWAWKNGADVVSNSWGGYAQSYIIENAIDSTLVHGRNGKGTIVVFAAGNEDDTNIRYPGNSNPDILVVGAISPKGERKSYTSCDNEGWGSCYGSQLDVVAPGVFIPTTTYTGGYTQTFNGTSSACPHVAGVAALVLSANPNLTSAEVRTIIEGTAQKVRQGNGAGYYNYQNTSGRPYGTWHQEMGYGLVNAYAAVQTAQAAYASGCELYIKDRPEDIGITPWGYDWQLARDKSPDIWVRNQPDGYTNFENQDPVYAGASSQVYVYVRVRNKGSLSSLGTEKLKLYWSRAASCASWPDNWTGTNPTIGDTVGTKTIPVIQPGHDTIIQFTWYINNPTDHWSQCLLAMIDAPAQPVVHYPDRLDDDVFFNKHVSLRNCFIIDARPCGRLFYIGNSTAQAQTMNLVMRDSDPNGRITLVDVADVYLLFDNITWQSVGTIFQNNSDVQIISPGRVKILTSNLSLNNIQWSANQRIPVEIEVILKSTAKHYKNEYEYEIQEYLVTGSGAELLGGVYYTIAVPNYIYFEANTSDVKTNLRTPVTLTAVQQNENVEYNWYDNSGELAGTGATITVNPSTSTRYTLEVSHLLYCLRDIAYANVTVNPNFITSVSPNPTTGNLDIVYNLEPSINTYEIRILNKTGVVMGTYSITPKLKQITVNVSAYPPGTYTLQLTGNGIVYDAKNFIKL